MYEVVQGQERDHRRVDGVERRVVRDAGYEAREFTPLGIIAGAHARQ